MCECNAFELEADLDESRTFFTVEQSPAGVTWAYDWANGKLGYTDDDFQFVPLVDMIHADANEVLTESVAIDEEYLWVLGIGGIYQIPVADLEIIDNIHTGEGILDFAPYADYRFWQSNDVHDFDIANGWVWWIEDRFIYKMEVTDFAGSPTAVGDIDDEFGDWPGITKDMLIATASDRMWITKMEQNPTFVAYDYDGEVIESIPVESVGSAFPNDMTVERDTDVLVVVARTSGD